MSASRVIVAHRLRVTPFTRCAFAAATLALLGTAAKAGCNSGSTGDTNVLHSAACQADAVGTDATAVGSDAKAIAAFTTSVGSFAAAGREGATRVGYRAGSGSVTGLWSTAIGGSGVLGVASRGDYSIAIGGGNSQTNPAAQANGHYGIAIGTGAQVNGTRSTVVGGFAGNGSAAPSTNTDNSAFGYAAGYNVVGKLNTALGRDSGRTVSGDSNSAFGYASGKNVTGNTNTAGGYFAGVTVNGNSNAAYGASAGRIVTGDANVAIGLNAGGNIVASKTIAVGAGASASRNGAVAIGSGASATKAQAVAIGQGSLANVANTVSVGSAGNPRRIVNVAPAVRPTDAVNLAQLQAALSGQAPAARPAGAVSLAQFEALLPAASVSSTTSQPAVAAASIGPHIDQVRRELRREFQQELAELRALVQRQQQEIVELKSRKATAARTAHE